MLPVTKTNQVDYDWMESYVKEGKRQLVGALIPNLGTLGTSYIFHDKQDYGIAAEPSIQ